MEFTDETIERLAEDRFRAQLIEVYRQFDSPRYVYLPKLFVINELNARIKKEDKQEKLKRIPLIGKMIYRAIPSNYVDSSERSKFVLSLMNNLNIDYLDKYKLNEIRANVGEFYAKYYRESYERKHRESLLKHKNALQK